MAGQQGRAFAGRREQSGRFTIDYIEILVFGRIGVTGANEL